MDGKLRGYMTESPDKKKDSRSKSKNKMEEDSEEGSLDKKGAVVVHDRKPRGKQPAYSSSSERDLRRC